MPDNNINTSFSDSVKHVIPVDSYGKQILAARKVMTRSITLTGSTTKDEIQVPKGCYEVNILSGTSVTFYESASTYTDVNVKADGTVVTNTFGSGYAGTNMTFPIYNQRQFWINGTGTITVMFSSVGA